MKGKQAGNAARPKGGRLGKWILRGLLAMTALTVVIGLSVLIFPGFWLGLIADIVVGNERIGKPPTDPAAASAAETKINLLEEVIFRPRAPRPPDDIVLSELEINSYIESHAGEARGAAHSERAEDALRDEKTAQEAREIADAVENLQVSLGKDTITVAGNIDTGKLAALIKRTTGRKMPEELARVVVFRAGFEVATRDGAFEISEGALSLGRLDLRDSAFASLLAEVTKRIDDYVQKKIRSEVSRYFEPTGKEGLKFRLPEEVREVSVSPGELRVSFNRP